MKALKIFLVFIIVIFFSNESAAQLVVKVKPVKPKVVVVKPVKVKAGHVWVNGHWKVNAAGNYVYIDGYHLKKRHGKIWVDGHWKKVPGGWKWTPGHWKAA